jgi:hypothetical protein
MDVDMDERVSDEMFCFSSSPEEAADALITLQKYG